jgi:hypothetical protein
MDFEHHVHAVQRYVKFTQPRYDRLFKPNVPTHPICVFGDPAKAVVVTVGANPSVGEFENHSWPAEQMTHDALAKRCRDYFNTDAPAPHHQFFTPWKQGLKCLGVSYESRSAAHLDLSPRATRYIRELNPGFESELFLEMVQRDLWVFFATLQLCPNVKVLLIAGSVTGQYYINEFLQRFAPDHGYAVGGAFRRTESKGPGKTCWHELASSGRKLPAFFCSSGPAAMSATPLVQSVAKNADQLRALLK